MKRIVLAGLAGCAAAVLMMTGFSSGARPQEGNKAGPKAMVPEKPGSEMNRLKAFEGTWEGEVTFCKEHAGGGTAKGVETDKIGLGGFWLIGDHKCDTLRGAYAGHDLLGYDQAKKEYILAVANSTKSELGLFKGLFSEDGKELVLKSEMTGPDGKLWKIRAVYTPKDENHYNFALITTDTAGKDCPCVSITYVRQSATSAVHPGR